MAQNRHDNSTLDLLAEYQPEPIVRRFEDRSVRAADFRIKIALAVKATLADAGMTREKIAKGMSDYLGENVPVNMLNAYASQQRDGHTISFLRAMALVYVTGDVRIIQMLAEEIDHSVVDNRHVEWIEAGRLFAARDEINKQLTVATSRAQAGTKP